MIQAATSGSYSSLRAVYLWVYRRRLYAFLLLFLLILTRHCPAQENGNNVHISNIPPAKKYDTIIIMSDIRLAEQMSARHRDSAVILLHRAMLQCREAGFPAGLKKALQLALPLLNESEKIRTLEYWQGVCLRSSRLEPALAVVYNAFAKTLQLQEQYERAGNYYMKAIPLAQKYDQPYLATLYNNYGSLLFTLPDDSVANNARGLYYLDKAEHIARKYQDMKIITCALCNKAKIYRNQRRYAESMDLSLQGLAIARQHHFTQWEYVLLNNIGDLYFTMGKPEQAIPYLKQCVDMKGGVIDPYYRNMAVFTLGEVYYAMGNMQEAERNFLQSLKDAQQYGIGRDLIEGNRKLALIYAGKKDYAKAFAHQFAYAQINDSLRSKQVMENVQRLEVRYRTSEKDRELLKSKLHIKQQEQSLRSKNMIILLSVALVLILALTFLVVYNRIRQRQRILLRDEQIREMKALMQGEEKERIRLAQELHDGIGGMLAAVNMNMQVARKAGFAHKDELLDIMYMIGDTAEEVRKTSHNLMPSALMRENLEEALQHYCSNINHDASLCIDLHVHGDINSLQPTYKTVVFRIVQELLQNVIKHAGATHVIVSLERVGNALTLMVEDNGAGFDSKVIAGGFGLENLKFKVKALNGDLQIQSEPGTGTSITIHFGLPQQEAGI